MLYVITDRGVIVGDNLNAINKKMDVLLEKEEFKAYGNDFVTRLNDIDIDFVRDKKRMSGILFGNFFRKEKLTKMLCIAILVISLITCILCSNQYSQLSSFLSSITSVNK